MKKIFRIILPCLALVAGLSSCQESLIDDKAKVDASHEATRQTPPTVTLAGSIDAPVYMPFAGSYTLSTSFTISDTTNVEECGLMISADQDFKTYSVSRQTVGTSVDAVATGVDGGTSYVRAFAVTKDGATIISNEVQTVTAEPISEYDIFGTYTARDYKYNKDTETFDLQDDTYEIEVSAIEGSDSVNVKNLWDAETTLKAAYNAKDGTISIPSESPFMDDPKYGQLTIKGINDEITSYTDNVVLTFSKKGGVMATTNYTILTDKGSFGYFYTEMYHK